MTISWKAVAVKAGILATAFAGGGAVTIAVADSHDNGPRMWVDGNGNIVRQTTSISGPGVLRYEALPSAQANHRLLGGTARPQEGTSELHFRVPDPVCVRVSWAGRGMGTVCWTKTIAHCVVDERLRPVECSISEKEGTFR